MTPGTTVLCHMLFSGRLHKRHDTSGVWQLVQLLHRYATSEQACYGGPCVTSFPGREAQTRSSRKQSCGMLQLAENLRWVVWPGMDGWCLQNCSAVDRP
jgi:hypothetical protein